MAKVIKRKPKILFFDIETMANLAWVWGKYEQDVISFVQQSYILCFAYKWLGESKTHIVSQRQFKGYKAGSQDDSLVVEKLWELFNEADIVVAHNGQAFDVKTVYGRFIKNGLNAPAPFKQIDTKLLFRKHFKLNSNKLDDIGEFLEEGKKLKHEGWDMWLGCYEGKKKSWDMMEKYNKQDVVLLEKVYKRVLPFVNNHPNYNQYMETINCCPNCGSSHLQKRGPARSGRTNITNQRYQCQSCFSWHQGPKDKMVR